MGKKIIVIFIISMLIIVFGIFVRIRYTKNTDIKGHFMEKLQPDIVKGNLITLKPLQEQFIEEYYHMFSPIVRQAIGLPSTSDLQETTDFLRAIMDDPQHLMFYCIFDNPTNKLIGAVVIRTPDHPNGQLGAWLNENFWGGERYQEALYLALKKYFDYKANNSIFAFVAVDNKRSLKAHQKMGFEIVQKSPYDAECCQGKKTHKIALTRVAFKLEQKHFE
jgi:RimJ/RimL family protein N-acetyltransferase